jgi:lipoyl-dependent peroxiredoxin subunit D
MSARSPGLSSRRARQAHDGDRPMSIDALRDLMPAYAKDISLNLGSLAAETVLNDQQKWGTFLASAHAVGVAPVVRAIEAQAATVLTPEAMNAAKAAAAIMGMNNLYYRSLHLMKNQEYTTIPARLRMNVIANPGVEKMDFELWSTAVSSINGCGACIDAHEGTLRKHGVPATQVQTALRIAAVVHAASRIAASEAALAG